MAVFDPQHRDEGLVPGTNRISLAGPLEELRYPPICPHCGAATEELPVTKVFRYSNTIDKRGWLYRITRAAPLFCSTCIARHHVEQKPPTAAELAGSVILSEQAIPAYCMIGVAFFLLKDSSADILSNPSGEWPMLAVIGILLLGSLLLFSTGLVRQRTQARGAADRDHAELRFRRRLLIALRDFSADLRHSQSSLRSGFRDNEC